MEANKNGNAGRRGRNAYRAGVGVALATAFFLIWVSLAVGINGPDGEPFDRIYIAVFAVGLFGAVVTRFRASGMARSLFAMALAQASVGILALIVGKHLSGVSPILEILSANGIFVVLFLASAFLFRKAAREQTFVDALP